MKGEFILIIYYFNLGFSYISMYCFYLKYLNSESSKMNHNLKEIQIEKYNNFSWTNIFTDAIWNPNHLSILD